jgi:predicted HTH domain antitoxin
VTIEQIERHPWYKMPLPDKYTRTLKKIEENQAELNVNIKKRRESEAAVLARKAELEAMVEEATHTAPVDQPRTAIKKIDLRETAVLERAAIMARESGNVSLGAAAAAEAAEAATTAVADGGGGSSSAAETAAETAPGQWTTHTQ